MTAVSRKVSVSNITAGTAGQHVTVTSGGTAAWLSPVDIDARAYGVVADAATDCTTFLQNAIAAAAALGSGQARGGTVRLPKGQILVNCGQITVPDCVNLAGAGATRTFLKAKPSATTGKWVVRIGDGTGICFRNVLSDMTVDASATGTTTCVYSSEAQEGSGLRNVICIGFTVHGVHWDGIPSTPGGGSLTGPPENSFMEYLELYGKGTSSEALFIDTCGEKIGVKYVTIRPDGAVGGHGGIVIKASNVDLQWAHVESYPQGVLFQTGGRGVVNQMNGNSDLTDCVHMNSDANATGICLLNIDKNSATNSIADGRHGSPYIHPDAQVALYCPEQGVPLAYAGDPNTHVTGTGRELCIDRTNHKLYMSNGAGTSWTAQA